MRLDLADTGGRVRLDADQCVGEVPDGADVVGLARRNEGGHGIQAAMPARPPFRPDPELDLVLERA